MKKRMSEFNIKKGIEKINEVYDEIPDTTGCLKYIEMPKEDGGCGGKCCLYQNPSVLYIEFMNTWKYVMSEYSLDELLALIEKAVRNYLSDMPTKGCVFFDREKKICTQHDTRPYNCLLPDTWVFTSHGPKKIKDIMAGDMVYDLNGKLKIVLQTASRWHSGPIHSVKQQGNHVSSWATDDHRWLSVQYKDKRQFSNKKTKDNNWFYSKDLIEKSTNKLGNYLTFPSFFHNEENLFEIKLLDYIDATETYEGSDKLMPYTSGKIFSDKNHQVVPKKMIVDSEFLFMIGIYLAEGSASEQSVSFCMNINEKEHLERIRKYLLKNGIYSRYKKRKNNLILRVDSCLMGRFFKKIGGKLSKNKEINEEFFSKLSKSQKYDIFLAWSIGDGRKETKDVKHSVSTVSEKLAIQMQQILLEKGIYPRVQIRDRENRANLVYEVLVNHSSYKDWNKKLFKGSKIVKNDDYIYAPLGKVDVNENYEGPVFDIMVDDTESFITSSGIVHNCRMYSQIPDEEFKPRYEALKVLQEKDFRAVVMPQCNLTETVGEKPTKDQSDAWWKKMTEIEHECGIPEDQITDDQQGTYRTLHDHIVLHVFPDWALEQMTQLKIEGSFQDKEMATLKLMGWLKGFMKKNSDKIVSELKQSEGAIKDIEDQTSDLEEEIRKLKG